MKFSLGTLLNGITQRDNNKKIEGYIGYFGLVDWWLSEFTPEERSHIEDVYHPMGSDPDKKPLTQGVFDYTSATASSALSGAASWFLGPNDRHIAKKLLEKAWELNRDSETIKIKNILDAHFILSEMITVYYRDREDPAMFTKAVDACRKQIALAPQAKKEFLKEYPTQALPSHRGYEQLIIILDKKGEAQEAIVLCNQAKEQGWDGDWDRRIERYEKKR